MSVTVANASCGVLEVLLPNTISDAQLVSSPVAEPDTTRVMPDNTVGEVAWVSHPSNVLPINARRIIARTHRTYRDTAGGVSTTSPADDKIRWFDEGPTSKWAAFDALVNTKTYAASPATWIIDPGAATDLELMGLENVDTVRVQVYDAAGGTIVYDQEQSTEELFGSDPHWSLYFMAPGQSTNIAFSGLPIGPSSRVVLTLSSFDGARVGVGLIAFGVYEEMGLPQFDFETVRRNYSYEEIDRWGNEVYTPGLKAKDLRGEAWIDADMANAVDRLVERMLDYGAIYRVTNIVTYRYLKAWGRLQPVSIKPAGPSHAVLSIEVRGKV